MNGTAPITTANTVFRSGHAERQGARVLGNGEPRIGAHDKPVLFLHPKDFCGVLVELEQA